MKPAARELDRFIARVPEAVRAVLLYGPDQGLVMERRAKVLGQWLDDVDDPMALTILAADELRQDPARLADETQAFSMLGGRRVVRLTEAADGVTATIAGVLDLPVLEAPLLVEARELPASSSLRRLFEQRANAAAVPCYRAEGRDLEALVRTQLQELGLDAEREAVDHLAANLGADRAVMARELEKLQLYLGEQRHIRLEDARACVGDGAALELDALIHAAAGGRAVEAQRLLDRLLSAKTTPVGIVRALQNHYRRLWAMAVEVEGGKPAAAVIDAARPPIFFRAKPAFARALSRRRATALRADLAHLVDTERRCKSTGQPADLLCRSAVLALASD